MDKAAPGWLARAIDRRPGSGPGGDVPGLHIHESFPLPQALAGGQQVVPSMARLEQFRRRLGMPAGPRGRRADRRPRSPGAQDRGEPGSLLQFVERCSLITYASSARLERVHQDSLGRRVEYPDFYGLARRRVVPMSMKRLVGRRPGTYSIYKGRRRAMANPFVHVELHTQDPQAAKKFYGELFDWKLEDVPEMNYTLIDVGEQGRGEAS